ncbi:acyltransferase [Oribacterium sp. NK2B42]|uniref:acyltransferase n=1 Tax=Oribacterium sp. NK2B42 TaxID=689781 RepID=UPI0004255DE9|nr:acyltransferase [Oribacterium sp. NK2B42]
MLQKKKVYIEYIRCLACALVIFNHLSGYTLYQVSHGWKQFMYMSLTMFTRINVPLFFMISGALLFEKEESINLVLKKRALRIFLDIVIFQFLMFMLNHVEAIRDGWDFDYSVGNYIRMLITNGIRGAYAYWYMYSYLGVLLVLPFMQRICKKLTDHEVWWLIFLHFINASLLAFVNVVIENKGGKPIIFTTKLEVPFAFVNCFFFPIVGYYLDHAIDIKRIKNIHLVTGGVVSLVCIFLENVCTYVDARTYGKYSQGYVQMFDYVLAIYIFILVKHICINYKALENNRISRVVCFIGSLTMGIYLIDPCLKMTIYPIIEKYAEPIMPTMIVSFIWIIISILLGGTITLIIKHTPVVKKLL